MYYISNYKVPTDHRILLCFPETSLKKFRPEHIGDITTKTYKINLGTFHQLNIQLDIPSSHIKEAGLININAVCQSLISQENSTYQK